MKIKVLINFGGTITKERRILPGIYEDNNPVLFGVANYLLEHGFAVPVEGATPTTEFTYTRPVEDNTFHNEIMKRKGRPVIPHAVTDAPEDTATEERTPQPKRNAKRR